MNGVTVTTQNGQVTLPEDRLAYFVDAERTVWIGYPRQMSDKSAAMVVTGFWVTQYNEVRSYELRTWESVSLVYADILRAVNPHPGDFDFDLDGMRYYGIIPKEHT